jgi:phosphoribosylanthranilate isomerase
MTPSHPQIKICGLTDPEEARACADRGADAIGLVFYPPSPRHLQEDNAREIVAALPSRVVPVGVFVDPVWEYLARLVRCCGLRGVQLHGAESPELAARVRDELGVTAIKALFAAKAPDLGQAEIYPGMPLLVECGRGALPGGNAEIWDWGAAREVAAKYPTILAGGLGVDNVGRAIAACRPDAVDVSSGVETAPGRKDLVKAARFIAAVRQSAVLYVDRPKPIAPIFGQSPNATLIDL